MADWQDTFPLWAAGWAAVRGQTSTPEGAVVVTAAAAADAPPEYIVAWPGSDADRTAETVRQQTGAVLTLVTAESGDALDYAAARGLATVGQAVLLTAPMEELNAVPELPENAELAQAPLELYDLVEISVFDHPVASGRIRIEDGLAVIGSVRTHAPESEKGLEAAVLAALTDEAYVHGAKTLYTVLRPHQVADYTASGWTVAAQIVSLSASE
ncbi:MULTISPECIES: hypothetical protein [Arthrobacter]|uniref:GNAT family N-acetyltransferase n=1 Tax=Arthrobacter methylotrophus TaxID=121291 RepID=A0ABV5UWC6_9MICC|nr:hypothetical protein [Arthrobacter sp. MA-N2]